MERRTFVKSAGALSLGTSLAGCAGFLGGGSPGDIGDAPPSDQTPGDGPNELIELDGHIAQDSAENLKFLDVDLYKTVSPVEASGAGDGNGNQGQDGEIFGPEKAGVGVKGVLKNVPDEPYTYVEVNVTLYDETDDVIGSWLDNSEEESIGRLESGEKWSFDVVFENADIGKAARYTVSADGQLA